MLETPWDLLEEYEGQLPQLEFYDHFPMSSMMSFVGNAMGGKNQKGGKTKSKDEMFNPMELLPYYAMTPEVMHILTYGGLGFTKAEIYQIADVIEARVLPTWAHNTLNKLQNVETMVQAVKPHLRPKKKDRKGNPMS